MRDCLELLPEVLERDERWRAFGNRSSEGVLELKYPAARSGLPDGRLGSH